MSVEVPAPRGEVPALRADGRRVWVASPTPGDVAAYVRAFEQSRSRLEVWNPVDPRALSQLLRSQSRGLRTLLVHARDATGDHDLVGKVNVTGISRGRFLSASLGYDAFDPYAGRGLFAEGLRLVIDLAFAPEPHGLGLHRVEASIQPGNVRSAALVRRLGFTREGHSAGLLHLPDASGEERWRDHDRYAVLSSEWPAASFARRPTTRTVALVNGFPGSGKTTLARRLCAELEVPLFSKDVVKEAFDDGLPADVVSDLVAERTGRSALGAGASTALWALLRDSPVGGVVESWFWRDDADHVRAGLEAAGLDPAAVPEVFCDVPMALARERDRLRRAAGQRHPVHGGVGEMERVWDRMGAGGGPLGLGHLLRVDTSREVLGRDVAVLAARIRAAWATSGNPG